MRKIAIKIGLLMFGIQLAFFSWVKIFSVDELTYLHGAWLITQGLIPFRDFDLPHHFLVCYLHSCLFLIFPDGVWPILFSRILMWVLFVSVALFVFLKDRESNFLWVGLVFLFLGASPLFIKHIIEIRADSLSFLLFLLSLFIVLNKYFSPPNRIGIASFFLVLSMISCVKVLVYGVPLALYLAADLVAPAFFHDPKYFFRAIKIFLISVGGLLITFVLWIYLTDSWSGMVIHSQMAYDFLSFPYKVSWKPAFRETILENFWVFCLACLGVLVSCFRIFRYGFRLEKYGVLLMATWIFALLSYTVQSRPYSYSLLPFWGVAAFLAASGAQWLFLYPNRLIRLFGILLVCSGFVFAFIRNHQFFDARLNGYQKQIWGLISELTDKSDVIFDNVGGFVFRPDTARHFSRSFPYMVNNWSTLKDLIPEQIVRSKCVAWMQDYRTNHLPDKVRLFLFENFIPYNDDLAFWGRHFRLNQQKGHDFQFRAIKADTYFIWPETVLEQGRVWINGQRLERPVFHLAEGLHSFRVSSSTKELVIAWLPRDGKIFRPISSQDPKFYKY